MEVVNNEERGLEEGRVMEDLLNDFPSVIPLNVKKSLLDLLSKNDDKDKNTHGNITLNTIRSKINEIETSGNEKVASDNLKTLKKLTFDIEDIITACSHEILKNNIKEKMPASAIAVKPIIDWTQISRRLDNIMNKCKDAIGDLKNVNLKMGDGRHRIGMREQPTGCLPNQRKIYGRDNDLNLVIGSIKKNSSNSGPCIIPIIGPSGIGKTTLLQHMYIDSRIKKDFERKGWVFVGKDINVLRLTRDVFECIFKAPCQIYTQEPKLVKDEFRRNLSFTTDQRCLLILDDVWKINKEFWEEFWQDGFIDTLKRFVILVTTQDKSVIDSMLMPNIRCTLPIVLKGLGDVPSRELFLSCYYRGGERHKLDDGSQKKDGSQKIIHNCKGVPSILKNSAHSFFRDCSGTERDVQRLKRMYCNLSERMKRCISFCSLFPENHKVERDYLIKLWIAEGFIHHDSDKSFDDISSEYFNILWNKSFFRFMPKSQNYEIPPPGFWDSPPSECYRRECSNKTYTVVTRSNNQNQNQQQENSTVLIASAKSHLQIHLSVLPVPLNENSNSLSANVRHTSFVIRESKDEDSSFSMTYIEDTTKSLFSALYTMEYLRSLDLTCTNLEELPEDFGRLIHLNFLGLSSTPIKMLPDSICKLFSLHTLELRNCKELEGLPKDIRFMISLTHLDINKNLTTFCMPTGIGELTELQTLARFNVGRHENFAGINELSGLNRLTDELCISGLCNVVSTRDCILANLVEKKDVKYLTLAWSPFVGDSGKVEPSDHHSYLKSILNKQKLVQDMDVLENLKPHSKLNSLTINSYDGSEFPQWMVNDSFEVLRLELENCNNADLQIPSLGLLPALEELSMDSMFLKKIGVEFCHVGNYQGKCFPLLGELEFKNLYEWEEWSEVSKDAFPMLRKVTFFNCPKLKKIPSFNSPKLRTLEIESCDGLKTLPEVCSNEKLRLILTGCDGIEEISIPEATTLNTLTVRYCTGLSSLPKYSVLNKLENLHLEDCENLKSNDLDTFLEDENTSLSSGIVHNCPQLKYNVYTIYKINEDEKNQIILEKNQLFTMAVYSIKSGSLSSSSSSFSSSFSSSSSSSSKNLNGTSGDFNEGQDVYLLSPYTNLRVARGTVAKIHPDDEIWETRLGKKCIGVFVKDIIIPDEDLIRPYQHHVMIGDVSNEIIAWQRLHLQRV